VSRTTAGSSKVASARPSSSAIRAAGRHHAAEQGQDAIVVQAMLGGARTPEFAETVDRHALLGAPRLQRRDLCGRGGASAVLGHVLHDLRAALGEVLDDVARHALHVRSPAVYRLPLDPQTLGQLATQNRLVEVAGGLPVPV